MASKRTLDDPVRMKAQQLREAQEKADRRTRAIIVSVVVVVVLAVVATVAIVISRQIAKKSEALTADPVAVLGDYASGEPILYSHLGVGKIDESLPTLTEYFDYSCHACADIDVLIGAQVSAGADKGEYNVKYQPVQTVGLGYMSPATSASLIVAQKDPEHWAAFHHALLAYFSTQFRAGKGEVIQDIDNSWKQVKVIASQVGVPESVSDGFPVNVVTDYLAASSQAWRDAPVQGRSKLGTPEFVNNDSVKIELSGKDPAAILASLRTGMGLPVDGAPSSESAQSE